MKERPILFTTEMVQAILAGHKTQTRRIIKPQPAPPRGIYSVDDAIPILSPNGPELLLRWNWRSDKYAPKIYKDAERFRTRSPYGQPGDLLWVRETYCWGYIWDGEGPEPEYYDLIGEERPDHLKNRYFYKADTDWRQCEWQDDKIDSVVSSPKWKSPRFMPKKAARLWLRITDIRVERLQDITEEDAKAEGITDRGAFGYTAFGMDQSQTAREAFQYLWQKINGPESWRANPWVWVISFEIKKQ